MRKPYDIYEGMPPQTIKEALRYRDEVIEKQRDALRSIRDAYFNEDRNLLGSAWAKVNDALEEEQKEIIKNCQHDWKDIRNKVIESGELCFKCGALRAGNESSGEKANAQNS